MPSSNLVWEALASSKERVVSANRIRGLAARASLDGETAIRVLTRNGRLLPAFKGYYYAKTPDEILLHRVIGSLDLFAMAAHAKRIGSWYYGLHTALRLNGMTHEHRSEEFVVSDGFYRPKGVPIMGRRFTIHKWRPELARFGLRKKGNYFWSDPEKTILDFAYLDYFAALKGRPMEGTWREHVERADKTRLREYMAHYPEPVRALVEGEL